MSSNKPILGYWNLRGLGQHIRLMLNYTGVEFEDKLYNIGPAPEYNRESWLQDKFSFGFDFPNLPYFIDGNLKVTQTSAIVKLIARKHGLSANNEEEQVKLDVLEDVAQDLRNGWVRLVYNPDFAAQKPQQLTTATSQVEGLSKYLGSNKWFLGDRITFIDFIIYELLDIYQTLYPDFLQNFKNLQCYKKCFEDLESIKKYMSSPKFLKSPLNGPMAAFGGQ